ncbi:hypothetical protein [Collimonas sp.]
MTRAGFFFSPQRKLQQKEPHPATNGGLIAASIKPQHDLLGAHG